MLEKLQTFADGRYTVPATLAEMLEDYHERRGDAGERVEELSLTKRITSTGRTLRPTRILHITNLTNPNPTSQNDGNRAWCTWSAIITRRNDRIINICQLRLSRRL